MRSATSAALLTLLCAVSPVMPAAAQTSVDEALALYSAAAYEDAIAALDRLPKADSTPADRAAADHVRMLCMLALGRTAEAEQAIASLLEGQPTYRLTEADAAPRVLRVFDDVRRRALPEVFRRRYREAKRLYDGKQFEQAATAFAVVGELIDDPDLASSGDPALADLIQLADGFADLTRAAVDAEERRAGAATTAGAADTNSTASAGDVPHGTAASPADPPSPIFDALDASVLPPVIERQDISRWFGPIPRPRPGTNLGSIEVVIDESGAVTAATIRASVSLFYDTVLLESAKSWRYQPATRQGRAVKFRRVVGVVMGS